MKSLLDKLGYKPGTPALLWRAPAVFEAKFADTPTGQAPTFLLAFVRDSAELAEAAETVAAAYRRGGHLWIAYPKKSGSIRSDIDRDHGWEPITALGLAAVTQIAVDADWSALRYRYRDEIRSPRRPL